MNVIFEYFVCLYDSLGFWGFALCMAPLSLAIWVTIALIRESRKINKLNPKHYPLDYMRKHKDEFEDYFKEYPLLLND